MASKIEPVGATVWDRRTISSIRRELEKSFAALTDAYNRAQREQTQDAQDEVTKLANQFYDLYEQRFGEYKDCQIDKNP